MKLREHLPLALAIAAVTLAVVQMVHPFGNRVPPAILIVAALLGLLRYLMQRQLRRRNKLLNEVPEHPLGILDDSK
jgi:Flp pilus assembly protein TadB